MIVKLEEESSAVLARVPSLTRWRVAPTMVRGSKSASSEAISKGQIHFSAMQFRRGSKKNGKKNAKKKTSKDKKKKTKQPKHALPEKELSASSLRRTTAGRAAIVSLVKRLNELDCEKNPGNPCFDDGGFCQIKFDGADTLQWEDMLQKAPDAFEEMQLDSFDLICMMEQGFFVVFLVIVLS